MTEPRARRGWFISSYSSNGSDCVEVRHEESGTQVRDSKNRTGATLSFGPSAWSAFAAAAHRP